MSVGEGALGEVKRYDFIFPLGAACSCSQSLRLANLQFASFPCDWLWGGSPTARARALVDGFDALLNESRLVKHGIPWKLEHEPWRNIDTDIVFKHDFDWNTSLKEMLPAVREKYARRLRRLGNLIAASKTVLVVWINPPNCAEAQPSEFTEIRRMLAAKWPSVEFEFLVTRSKCGRPFVERSDEIAEGVRTVSWDYDDGREAFIDNQKMAAFLAAEYAMKDYRTDAERAAWPERQTALKYAQYNATSWWGFVVNRFWYRLYRHVRKEIERRGLHRLG